MSGAVSKQAQILQTHATLIVKVVMACQNMELQRALEPILKQSEQQGWLKLMAAIRRILAGKREANLLNGLDEEDAMIVTAILNGLQNPETLPDPNAEISGNHAAPGIATMIYSAGRGDVQALQGIATMAEQMSAIGGDMARLASHVREMIKGERDANILCKNMTDTGEQLMLAIIHELDELDKNQPVN